MSRTSMLLVIGFVAVLAPTVGAQVAQASSCAYETCAVRHTVGFFGERIVRGAGSDEVLKISFTGGNAADFLGRVESAAGPARDFRTRRTRSSILAIIGGATAAYFFSRVSYLDGEPAGDNDPDTVDYVVLGAGLVTAVWGGIESVRSRNSLSRAIWEFNRAPVP